MRYHKSPLSSVYLLDYCILTVATTVQLLWVTGDCVSAGLTKYTHMHIHTYIHTYILTHGLARVRMYVHLANMPGHLWGRGVIQLCFGWAIPSRYRIYQITPDVPLSWRRLMSCGCVNVTAYRASYHNYASLFTSCIRTYVFA